MHLFRIPALLLLCALAGTPQTGFSVESLDQSVNPCSNFYQYACGTWLKNNPTPQDQSVWGRFSALHERSQAILRDILETSRAKADRTAAEQKIGDYFAACMDEKSIETKGTQPLQPWFKPVDALTDKKALTTEIVRLHLAAVNAMFATGSEQEMKNADEVIARVDQGGLGLPERDYYFKEDEKSVEVRKQYVTHIQRMFELLGNNSSAAAAMAGTVIRLETALAKGHLDVTARRDPSKVYHRMDVSELAALAPSIDWKAYLTGMGAPVQTLNVAVPGFFRTLEETIGSVDLADWKTYLKWHILRAAAPLLPSAFVNENFAFQGRILTGAKELRPRWKRCVQFTDSDLGEALGQKYVELTFGKEGKERTLAMVRALERALDRDIRQLDWMTPETKKRAAEKLHAITNKIGYPEKWRDYSALGISAGDALGNSFRSNTFEMRRQMGKIGKPVDKQEWYMTPPTVNAYYDPQNNNINFPAGILQPPFYDNRVDAPVNLGGIGAVIGHELTHGFDDEGSQFDAKGNLSNWWTEKDAKEFAERTQCIEKQYSQYTATAELKLNGKLTLGENVADNGGLRIAHMAMLDMLAGSQKDKTDGFTPEQRFFLGWGQIWCENQRPESLRLRTQTDPHSPAEWRVNGTVSNMPEFWRAFGCSEGQPMVRGANACRVW